MEWSKGMTLRDYAIGLLEESSRRHGYRNRITMSKAMAEARMARGFYRIERAFGIAHDEDVAEVVED